MEAGQVLASSNSNQVGIDTTDMNEEDNIYLLNTIIYRLHSDIH